MILQEVDCVLEHPAEDELVLLWLEVEEILTKSNFVNYRVHQHLIHRLEVLFYQNFLILLTQLSVRLRVFVHELQDLVSVHQLEDGPVLLAQADYIPQVQIGPIILRVVGNDDVVAKVDFLRLLRQLARVELEVGQVHLAHRFRVQVAQLHINV